MRKLAFVVLAVAAISLMGNVVLAECAGKSHAPIKTATQSTPGEKTSG